MCFIISLPAGKTPHFDKFRNGVLNNPHGWGLVTVDRGKLEVRKVFNPNGNDPDEIYKSIKDAEGIERYLHCRYNTVGENSYDNTHPFTVFKNPDRHVEFMHNGTIYQYKDSTYTTYTNGVKKDSFPVKSDTRKFAELWLAPMLEHFTGENGVADYNDPFFRVLMGKEFPLASNRGLLISNDLEPSYFGKWEEFQFADGEDKFMVSNNDYFNHVQAGRTIKKETTTSVVQFRGESNQPPFEGGKKEASSGASQGEKREEKTAKLAQLKDTKVSRSINKRRLFRPSDLRGIFDFTCSTFEEISNDELSNMVYLTEREVADWLGKDTETGAAFILNILERFAENISELESLTDDLEAAKDKHETATKLVATVKEDNKRLAQQVSDLQSRLASFGVAS